MGNGRWRDVAYIIVEARSGGEGADTIVRSAYDVFLVNKTSSYFRTLVSLGEGCDNLGSVRRPLNPRELARTAGRNALATEDIVTTGDWMGLVQEEQWMCL